MVPLAKRALSDAALNNASLLLVERRSLFTYGEGARVRVRVRVGIMDFVHESEYS